MEININSYEGEEIEGVLVRNIKLFLKISENFQTR